MNRRRRSQRKQTQVEPISQLSCVLGQDGFKNIWIVFYSQSLCESVDDSGQGDDDSNIERLFD